MCAGDSVPGRGLSSPLTAFFCVRKTSCEGAVPSVMITVIAALKLYTVT
jgi:hypothetical protein